MDIGYSQIVYDTKLQLEPSLETVTTTNILCFTDFFLMSNMSWIYVEIVLSYEL